LIISSFIFRSEPDWHLSNFEPNEARLEKSTSPFTRESTDLARLRSRCAGRCYRAHYSLVRRLQRQSAMDAYHLHLRLLSGIHLQRASTPYQSAAYTYSSFRRLTRGISFTL